MAVLFSAAALLTSAHDSTVLMTAPLTAGTLSTTETDLSLLPSGYGYILAGGLDDAFPTTTVSNPPSAGTPEDLKVQNGLNGVLGLGLANTNLGQDNGYIGPTDAIVLDFSNVKNTTVNSITFSLYEDYGGSADYVVWGTNETLNTTTGKLNTTGTPVYTLIASGVTTNSTPLTISTSGTIYTSYVVGLTNDCAMDIQGVEINAPEPGTFVLAGMALIGLGVTLKRRSGKA